ncbi:MAG: hypothetical protein RLZZ337_1386 [Bacteroidota bacterium]|jgi:hypothetical protein
MKILFILFLSIFSLSSLAQDKYLPDVAATQKLSKEVSQLFYDDYIGVAFKKLMPYWPLPADEIQGLEEKTIRYLNMLDDRFGEKVEVVRLKEETIKDFAIRETYLIRYEKSAIRLQFSFYKNDKGWIVNAFKWDDSLSEEFE